MSELGIIVDRAICSYSIAGPVMFLKTKNYLLVSIICVSLVKPNSLVQMWVPVSFMLYSLAFHPLTPFPRSKIFMLHTYVPSKVHTMQWCDARAITCVECGSSQEKNFYGKFHCNEGNVTLMKKRYLAQHKKFAITIYIDQ